MADTAENAVSSPWRGVDPATAVLLRAASIFSLTEKIIDLQKNVR